MSIAPISRNELASYERGEDVQVLNPSAITMMASAEMTTSMELARRFRRKISTFFDQAQSVACISKPVAASCCYAKPQAGSTTKGPSVRLAEIVASTYGNLSTSVRVSDIGEKTVTVQAICHDLESNNKVAIEVMRSIWGNKGRYSQDMILQTIGAATSIGFRNAVFRVVPRALVDTVYQACLATAAGDQATIEEDRLGWLEYFASKGVSEARVCEILEVRKAEDIGLEGLGTLAAMDATVKAGEARWDEIAKAPTVATSKPEGITERLKARAVDSTLLPDAKAEPARKGREPGEDG